MKIEIDGREIGSEQAFHKVLATSLDFPSHYGANLDALWDTLSADIERPIHLVWQHSSASREIMPNEFEKIVAVLRRIEQQDKDWGLDERFLLELA